MAEPAEQTSGSYPSERPRGPQAHHQGRKTGQRAGRGQGGHPVVRSPCPRLRMQLWRDPVRTKRICWVWTSWGPSARATRPRWGPRWCKGCLRRVLRRGPSLGGGHCEAMPVGVGGRTATRHGQCDVGSRHISADGGTGRAGSTAALLNTARFVLWPGRSCGWSY